MHFEMQYGCNYEKQDGWLVMLQLLFYYVLFYYAICSNTYRK